MIILKLVRFLGGVLAHVSVLQHKVFNSHCEFGLIITALTASSLISTARASCSKWTI